MNQQTTYKRTCAFSEIDVFQKSHSITYQFNIVPTGADFLITSASSAKTQDEMLTFLYCNADYRAALNLATFLCENTIGIANCLDILRDYSIPFLLLPRKMI